MSFSTCSLPTGVRQHAVSGLPDNRRLPEVPHLLGADLDRLDDELRLGGDHLAGTARSSSASQAKRWVSTSTPRAVVQQRIHGHRPEVLRFRWRRNVHPWGYQAAPSSSTVSGPGLESHCAVLDRENRRQSLRCHTAVVSFPWLFLKRNNCCYCI